MNGGAFVNAPMPSENPSQPIRCEVALENILGGSAVSYSKLLRRDRECREQVSPNPSRWSDNRASDK